MIDAAMWFDEYTQVVSLLNTSFSNMRAKKTSTTCKKYSHDGFA